MAARTWGGWTLITIAAVMLLGFFRSSASIASPAAIFALLLTVGLPAAGGVALLRGVTTVGGKRSAREQRLRQQTIEAEILRLAMQRAGKLTAVEVASSLALPQEEAAAVLNVMVERELADLEVTDDGVLVYTFHDAKHLEGKHSPERLIDD